jgi:hypothetical protein
VGAGMNSPQCSGRTNYRVNHVLSKPFSKFSQSQPSPG